MLLIIAILHNHKNYYSLDHPNQFKIVDLSIPNENSYLRTRCYSRKQIEKICIVFYKS